MRLFAWASVLSLAVTGVAEAAPNLKAISISGPTDAIQGAPVMVTLEALSEGGDTASMSWNLYLTTNGAISGARLLRTLGPSPVSSNQTQTIQETVVLPSDATGQFILAAELDGAAQINEPNELDNVVAATDTIRIRPQLPDFMALSVGVQENQARPGEPVTVDFEVKNGGELEGTFEVVALMSKNGAVTIDDWELGRTELTLAAGEQVSGSIAGTAPADARTGDYNVGLFLDPTLAVEESVELNNLILASTPLNIFKDTLTFITTSLPVGAVYQSYWVQLEADGGNGHFGFDIATGVLPAGLSFDGATGVISGTPVQSAERTVTFEVTSNGLSAEASLGFDIEQSGLDLTVVTDALREGTVGLPYEGIIVAAGGEQPYTFSVPDGELPPGLDIGTSGTISGVPRQDGTYTFDIRVEDSSGQVAISTLTIQVSSPNLTIRTGLVDSVPLLEEVDVAIEASGGVAPYVWTALSDPPPGLTLTEDGRLTGAPSEVGRFPVRVRVSDSSSTREEDTALIHIQVEDFGTFAISTQWLEPGRTRRAYERVIQAEGGVEPLTWRLVPGDSLPTDFVLEQGDGEAHPARDAIIRGESVRELSHGFTLEVRDAANRQRLVPLAIHILRPEADASDGSGCECVAPARGARFAWFVPMIFGVALLGLRRRR